VLQRLHPNKQALGVLISISFCFGERRRLCAASGGRHCDVACAFPLSPQKHFLPQLELLNELLKRSAPFELPFPWRGVVFMIREVAKAMSHERCPFYSRHLKKAHGVKCPYNLIRFETETWL
jgi:hypothetical protein